MTRVYAKPCHFLRLTPQGPRAWRSRFFKPVPAFFNAVAWGAP
jgi:hypothetical protein